MKRNFEELVEYIKVNTSPEFNNLIEKVKKDKKKVIKWFFVLAIIIDILIVYIFYNNQRLAFLPKIAVAYPIVFVDLLLFMILSVCFSKNEKAVAGAFKSNIIQKMLCNFYNNVDYIPEKMMPEDIYEEAKYNESYDKYCSDDYMEASIDNKYDIKMAEIDTVEIDRHTDSNGQTTYRESTIFHGLFAKIQMEKSINSNLLIRENNSFLKKDRLEMDSQEFEKLFDVSATNQIIGMQILTHDIMELLISFKQSTGIEYDISIYNNVMYLRFNTTSMFECPSIKKGFFDGKSLKILKQYYDVLDFTYTLSKTIIDLIENTEI